MIIIKFQNESLYFGVIFNLFGWYDIPNHYFSKCFILRILEPRIQLPQQIKLIVRGGEMSENNECILNVYINVYVSV